MNTHEIATISGLAAAWRLGADYPFAENELAVLQFDLYLSLIHGKNRICGSRGWVFPLALFPIWVVFAVLVAGIAMLLMGLFAR